jgi:hypothetical protein
MSRNGPDSPLAADARRAFLIWLCAGLGLLAVVAGLCVLWSLEKRGFA